MAKARAKPTVLLLDELIAEKSLALSKAQAFGMMGMAELVQPLWASAAGLEEPIAALLDACGDDLEAAVHRVSAASCYEKAGELSRAANLFRAALAGPLREVKVLGMLADCLARLKASALPERNRKGVSAT